MGIYGEIEFVVSPFDKIINIETNPPLLCTPPLTMYSTAKKEDVGIIPV